MLYVKEKLKIKAQYLNLIFLNALVHQKQVSHFCWQTFGFCTTLACTWKLYIGLCGCVTTTKKISVYGRRIRSFSFILVFMQKLCKSHLVQCNFYFFIYLVKLCSQLSHKRSGKVSSDYQNFLKQIENFKHLKLFFLKKNGKKNHKQMRKPFHVKINFI